MGTEETGIRRRLGRDLEKITSFAAAGEQRKSTRTQRGQRRVGEDCSELGVSEEIVAGPRG